MIKFLHPYKILQQYTLEGAPNDVKSFGQGHLISVSSRNGAKILCGMTMEDAQRGFDGAKIVANRIGDNICPNCQAAYKEMEESDWNKWVKGVPK
jgi:hypothetical protein